MVETVAETRRTSAMTWRFGSLLGFTLVTALYLILLHPPAAASAALAAVVIVVTGFFPVYFLVHGRGEHLTILHYPMYAVIGLAIISIVDILLLSAGIRSNILLVCLILPFAAAGVLKFVRTPASFVAELRWVDGLAVLFVAQFAFSYAVMAAGETPAIFLNADTPFYLGQVHALISETSWPVASLNVLGNRLGYHYGVQNAAAILSRLSGLAPHTALFGACVGLMAVTIAAAAVAVARSIGGAGGSLLPLGLLLLFGLDMSHLGAGVWFLGARPGPFPHPGGLFGLTATFICLYALVRGGGRNLALVTITIIAAAFARTTDFLALMMGLGLLATAEAVLRRRFTAVPYVVVAATLSAVVLSLTVGSNGGSLAISVGELFVNSGFFKHAQAAISSAVQGEWASAGREFVFVVKDNLVWISFVLAVLAFGLRPTAVRLDLVAFVLPPIVVLNLVGYVNTGLVVTPGEPERDLSHALATMAQANSYFWWALLAFYIGGHVALRRSPLARGAFVALRLLIGGAIVLTTLQLAELVRNPSAGIDYVSNTSVADALQRIPVPGSILVTNDLRYPAENYSRNDRQFQLSALFGHQNFASVLWYEGAPDYLERKRLNALLGNSSWSPEIAKAAREWGWSHYLVHKDAPHPTAIPLSLVYENDEYAVYMFRQ